MENAGVLFLYQPLHLHGPGVVAAQDKLPRQRPVYDVGAVLVPVASQHGLVGYDAVGQGRGPQRADVFHGWQADLPYLDPQFLQGSNRVADGGLHLAVNLVEEVVGRHSGGESRQIAVQPCQVVGDRNRDGAGIERVVSGQGL